MAEERDEPLIPRSLVALTQAFERVLILAALEAAGGHQRRAAGFLGVLPTTLNEKLKRLQLVSYARCLAGGEEECPACGARRPPLEAQRAALGFPADGSGGRRAEGATGRPSLPDPPA
jgi:hypothetical protein